MKRIAATFAPSALLLPSLAHAHDGLHHTLGLEHGATTASPLLFDLAGGVLIAAGLVLAWRLWRRPMPHRLAALAVAAVGAGLLTL